MSVWCLWWYAVLSSFAWLMWVRQGAPNDISSKLLKECLLLANMLFPDACLQNNCIYRGTLVLNSLSNIFLPRFENCLSIADGKQCITCNVWQESHCQSHLSIRAMLSLCELLAFVRYSVVCLWTDSRLPAAGPVDSRSRVPGDAHFYLKLEWQNGSEVCFVPPVYCVWLQLL